MKRVKIALIDSGVDCQHMDLYGKCIEGFEIKETQTGASLCHDIEDANGHGTAAAGIIFDKCPEAYLLSIKVLNQELGGSCEALCKGIQFAIDSNVDIINLSLGATDTAHQEALQKVCRLAGEKGLYIVSAYSNKEASSYPAVFPEVFGVRGRGIPEKYGFVYACTQNNDIYAKGVRQKVLWLKNSYKYSEGNSLACAHFTGILADILQKEPNISENDLKLYLLQKSLKDEAHASAQAQHMDTHWIKKGLLFPLVKENLDMLKMTDQLDHEIIGLYDERFFYQDTYIYETAAGPKKIPLYHEPEEALSHADTLLVGDMDFLPMEKRKRLKRQVITKAVEMGKNIFSKDALPPDEYAELYRLAEQKKVIIRTKYL